MFKIKDMKKIYGIMLGLALSSSILVSCKESFIEQPPIGAYDETIYTTPDGINKALTGAYVMLRGSIALTNSPLQPLFGSIHGGEALKGSSSGDQPAMIEVEKSEITIGNPNVQTLFSWYYQGISRCNTILRSIPNVSGVSDAQKTQIEAETKFLRSHFYFMLKRAFKNIPWVDETATDVRVSNTDEAGNYVNIWPEIAADMDFARKNLPAIQSEVGRPNKSAADTYYAKILIYRGNEGEKADAYTEALAILTSITGGPNAAVGAGITSKGEPYALLPNYHDNFNADKENNSEAVFSVQLSVNDGSTEGNNGQPDGTYWGIYANAGGATGWGFFQPTQWFVDHFRVDANGLPYIDNATRIANTIKSDDGIAATSPFTPDAGFVDPRLDWSVGRRDIPYLDWGLMGGPSWIREPNHGGPYVHKKFMHYKKDVNKHTQANSQVNDINMPIIRYSDVLLMAAEVEARVGSIENARLYVNKVRNRMAQNSSSPDNWVKKDDGTNAANYKIALYPAGAFSNSASALDAILYERSLELGLEGSRFYDLVRFGEAEKELNAYLTFESQRRGHLTGGVYTNTPDALLPIPNTAIINSQKDGKATLKQNPDY